MMEKIDWYKEVLELEPNSKVFFPLARLLVKENEEGQAIKILEKGLDRHPEYLEARLFLIELLYRQGDKAECDKQVTVLRDMFASYAGFWQAWAACLQAEPEEADTASILRFLAARFITGPLQLHEVIDRGIASLLNEKVREQDIAQSQPLEDVKATLELEINTEDSAHDVSESDMDVNSNSSSDDGQTPNIQESMQAGGYHESESVIEMEREIEEDAGQIEAAVEQPLETGFVEMEAAAQDENGNAVSLAGEMVADTAQPEMEENAVAAFLTVETGASENSYPESENFQDMEVGAVIENGAAPLSDESLKENEAESDSQEADAESEVSVPDQAVTVRAEAEEAAVVLPDHEENESEPVMSSANLENLEPASRPEKRKGRSGGRGRKQKQVVEELPEEGFSVRTRSMAEVLAEQGDLTGALDIYKELSQNATDPDELADINHRMGTLNARLHGSENTAPERGTGSQTREKLIDMLEALANRVEARAGN